jgi:hypothetical protein
MRWFGGESVIDLMPNRISKHRVAKRQSPTLSDRAVVMRYIQMQCVAGSDVIHT